MLFKFNGIMGFGSYRTAHSMSHKIRAAMMQPQEKLGGIVEIDETYVGGEDKNRHWDKKKGHQGAKMPVIGAVQRKGNVIARVLAKRRDCDILTFVTEVVSDKVSRCWRPMHGRDTGACHTAVYPHRL